MYHGIEKFYVGFKRQQVRVYIVNIVLSLGIRYRALFGLFGQVSRYPPPLSSPRIHTPRTTRTSLLLLLLVCITIYILLLSFNFLKNEHHLE